MVDFDEAFVQINTHTLTAGQSMVIRIALTDLRFRMEEVDALGGDKIGKALAAAYFNTATDILKLMEDK